MRRLFIVLSLVVSVSACAKRGQVQVSDPGVVMASAKGTVVEGRASYYGDPYHGRATANGETFDKNKLTAAHRTLPFNTWVRVQNQLNRKTVDVRINDRSSFVGGHHIDLSEGAARKIEMIRSGVVPVRMEIIKEADPGSRGRRITKDVFYVVQLGAFRDQMAAQDIRRRFASKYTGIYVDPPTDGSPFYKVRIGRFLLRKARYVQDLLRREDNVDAIVVQMQ